MSTRVSLSQLVLALPIPAPGASGSSTVGCPRLVVTEHLKWARMIARGTCRSFRFHPRSQEEQDLEATAYLAIVELAARFDPARVPPGGDVGGAFRGWAAIAVRTQCQREARRLRNGGTYHTRRERAGDALVVTELSRTMEIPDPRTVGVEEVMEDDAEDVE